MKIILLSGGSGKRLWPLSNDIRSKQFLKLLKNESGESESMVQRVYRQIKKTGIDAEILVATGENQRESIKSQLGNAVDIVLEPERRDTFPAIMLASSYIFFKNQMNYDEVVVIIPVDPYADMSYFEALKNIEEKIAYGKSNIALMGIKPTYPSAKYGYLIPDEKKEFVHSFHEKPDEKIAEELISDGALWNGGVFAFKVGYIMNKLSDYIGFQNYDDVHNQFSLLPKTSFDYEVVEKEESIAMVEYTGIWKDLGTWNTLTEVMESNTLGKVVTGKGCQNTHVINELNVPITVLGMKDVVIAASPDGIVVSDKHASSYLKDFVGGIVTRPMCEESGWGDYQVIDYVKYQDGNSSLTKSLFVKAGECLKYQEHAIRDEVWVIVDGLGDIVIDGHVRNVRRGDVVCISKGQRHSVLGVTDLRLIEVELGTELVETDVIENEWSWDYQSTNQSENSSQF